LRTRLVGLPTNMGSPQLTYCTENNKGLYISIFWTIFNLGAVVGSSVALGQNFHSEAGSVGTGTYVRSGRISVVNFTKSAFQVGFLVLTLIGVCIPMLMADPRTMYRSDGSKVTSFRHPTWRAEIVGLWVALRTDPSILMLFPMFLASVSLLQCVERLTLILVPFFVELVL
jgi:hypothetical protein